MVRALPHLLSDRSGKMLRPVHIHAPFDQQLHDFRGFSGQIAVYRWLRSLLDGEPEPEYYDEQERPSPPAPLPILGEG